MTALNAWRKLRSALGSHLPAQFKEVLKIVTGNDPLGQYELRMLRDGTELELAGPITFGATAAVKEIIKAHPTVAILHLNSAGGRLAEARALAAYIARQGLVTYTATGCFSASVLPYAAGKERLMAREAALGFHQYAFPGMDQEDFETDYERDKEFLAARGIAPDFIERIFEAPSDQFWIPSHEELFAAGYVTRYAQADEVALSGATPTDDADIEAELLKIPLYAAVKETDPMAYDQMSRAVRKAVRKGQSLADIRAVTLPLVQKMQAERLARASDEALISFTKLLVEQLTILNRVDPLLGYAFAYGGNAPGTDFSQYFSAELSDKELDVGAAVIRTFDASRHVPSEADVQKEMERLFTGLAGIYGQKVALITKPSHTKEERLDTSLVLCSMYRRILTLPPKRAVPVLRHVFYSGK